MRTATAPVQQIANAGHLAKQVHAAFSEHELSDLPPISFIQLRAAPLVTSEVEARMPETHALQHAIGFFVAEHEGDCQCDELEFENDREEGWF